MVTTYKLSSTEIGHNGKPEDGVTSLIARLDVAPNEERIRIIKALVRLQAKQAVGPLIALLEDDNVAIAAAMALAHIGDLRALRPLIELLKKNKPSAHAVCVALRRFGEHAAEPLIQVLLDPDARPVHDLVLTSLWMLGDERAIEPILEVLNETDDPKIKYSAIIALGYLKARQAIEPLSHILHETTDFTLRRGSAIAIAKIGTKQAIDVLLGAREHGAPEVQRKAALALGKMESGEAVQSNLAAQKYADRPKGSTQLTPGDLRSRRALEATPNNPDENGHSPPEPAKQPVAISVISNSHLFSDGLTSLLQDQLHLQLIGTYRADIAVSDMLPNPSGHIVLVDSAVGHEHVIALIRKWRSLTPPPWLVVLELPEDADIILRCIEAGASGYTLMGSSVVELAEMIRGGQRGAARCSPQMTARLFERLARLSASQKNMADITLTRREMQILHCIVKGYSNKEIARALFIEVRTVKHHVHNVLSKLQVKHRWDAARLATRDGWLEHEVHV